MLAISVSLGVAGCQTMGPQTLPQDRVNYSQAVADSWKEQMLLNTVKFRYADPPVFVDVGQIVAGYSRQYTGSVGVLATNSALSDNISAGGNVQFIDRPTITYVPLTGQRYLQGLVTPIPPQSLFFAIQAGWPADMILKLGVSSINGLRSTDFSSVDAEPGDPRFERVVQLVRKAQVSGMLSLRIVTRRERGDAALLTIRPRDATEASLADAAELRTLLGLAPDVHEFDLVYGSQAANDRELAVLTRSLLHVMTALSGQAQVPAAHVEEGRAWAGARSQDVGNPLARFHILSSRERPENAFVTVRYRDYWFYIDDRDFISKRAFGILLLLTNLTDTGESRPPPLITIPAQ